MGLRLSEALQLSVNDIDIDSHTLQVHIREGTQTSQTSTNF